MDPGVYPEDVVARLPLVPADQTERVATGQGQWPQPQPATSLRWYRVVHRPSPAAGGDTDLEVHCLDTDPVHRGERWRRPARGVVDVQASEGRLADSDPVGGDLPDQGHPGSD